MVAAVVVVAVVVVVAAVAAAVVAVGAAALVQGVAVIPCQPTFHAVNGERERGICRTHVSGVVQLSWAHVRYCVLMAL